MTDFAPLYLLHLLLWEFQHFCSERHPGKNVGFSMWREQRDRESVEKATRPRWGERGTVAKRRRQ